ncbi:MAG: hypothetical protein M3498_11280 [Deinococcota bacterium]|jgi:putative N6-adenine-specific DNA methylase|nr:hypothetical protein [Deinococcota bacterium]
MLSERALERRLKRHVYKATQRYLASCAPGLEQVLVGELRALGAAEIVAVRGGAEFSGPLDLLYHGNLWLRTANRLLWRQGDFLAQSYPMLFNKAVRLRWELMLGFAPAFAVRVSARASRLRHGAKIAETLHSAALEALEPLGLAPALLDDAPLTVHARLFQDRCTLSLDSSGELLFRRGYRQATAKAPIRETLAAGCLLEAGWQNFDLIADPMCGSGTLLLEAAGLAEGTAPGLNRSFAFEHFPSFQPSKWQRLRREARSAAPAHPDLRLVGADHALGALRALYGNAERAGLRGRLEVMRGDATSLDYGALRGSSHRPLIISNPPYGLRLGEGEVMALYRALGQRLRETAKGWNFALISPHARLLETAGLEVGSVTPFENGGVRVGLYRGRV